MSDPVRAWFPFHPADWLLSPTVRAMSFAARGLYAELLCWQWRDGSIPHAPEDIARLTGATPEVVSECLPSFPGVNGRRRKNKRMERDRQEQEAKHAKRVTAGRMGGRPKKQSESNALAKPDRKKESERKKEGLPSAGTNTTQTSYECEACGETVEGFVAFAKHQDKHKGDA